MQFNTIEAAVYLIGNFFRIYIISILFGILLHKTELKIMKVLRQSGYILFYVINSSCFLFFEWPDLMIFLTNIIGTTLISITYEGTWKFRIGAVLLSAALYTVCEDSIYYLLVFLEVKYIVAIGIIAANLLFFMIVQLMKKLAVSKSHIVIPIEEWLISIIIPVLSLLTSMIVLDECSHESSAAIGGICLIVINMLLFFRIDRIQDMYQKQVDIGLLKQQNQAYENQMLLLKTSEERLSSLRHDLKNHLLAIEKMALKNSRDSVEAYLNSLFSEAEDSSIFAETGNYVIDAFINSKLANAKHLGITVKTDLTISKNLNIEPRDISVILGNLLDNAVEAAVKCEKRKEITVIMREDRGKLSLKIKNSYRDKIKSVKGRILSTKSNQRIHGIGLQNVRKVVEKYQGTMKIDYADGIFSVSLVLFL